MKSIRIESFDLNLLKLFVALAETGSVTAAAARVGLTQPSASNALSRLRLSLGDPLFVRTQGGMMPTASAAEVLPSVRAFLLQLAETLNRAAAFDPSASQRCFNLSLSGLGEVIFLPPLVAALTEAAPRLRLKNEPVPLSDLATALDSGRIDLTLGMVSPKGTGLRSLTLYTDRYVVVAAPGQAHPAASLADLAQERLILAAPAATYGREIQAILTRLGLEGNVALTVQEFSALPELLQGGRYLAVVPAMYARTLERAGWVQVLPVALDEAATPVNMIWSPHSESDAGLTWFRALIARTLGRTDPASQDRE